MHRTAHSVNSPTVTQFAVEAHNIVRSFKDGQVQALKGVSL